MDKNGRVAMGRLSKRAKQTDEPARKVATFLLWLHLGCLKIDTATFFVMDDAAFEDCIIVLRAERNAWRTARGS